MNGHFIVGVSHAFGCGLSMCSCSETLQLSTLHFVIQLMAASFENMVLNKRERELALAWSHR